MERYARQEMIPGWNPQVVHSAKVMVAGAGTTGNELVKNLALVGIGKIVIVDTDVVEEVNLSRSVLFRKHDIGQPKAGVLAQRATEINPDVEAAGLSADIIHDLGSREYAAFDCVFAAVDNNEARLWLNRYCWVNGTPLINTGIGGMVGNVFVAMPPQGPCVECGWPQREYQELAERHSCSKEGLVFEEPKIPMVITTAAVVAGIAVQECLCLLHGEHLGAHNGTGRVLQYLGGVGGFVTWRVPRREDCPGHLPLPGEMAGEVGLDQPLGEVKAAVSRSTGQPTVEVWHDKAIVYSVRCNRCGWAERGQPCLLGRFQRRLCPRCGALSVVSDERSEELRGELTLRSYGIACNSILRVICGGAGEVKYGWILVT